MVVNTEASGAWRIAKVSIALLRIAVDWLCIEVKFAAQNVCVWSRFEFGVASLSQHIIQAVQGAACTPSTPGWPHIQNPHRPQGTACRQRYAARGCSGCLAAAGHTSRRGGCTQAHTAAGRRRRRRQYVKVHQSGDGTAGKLADASMTITSHTAQQPHCTLLEP